MPTAKKSGPVSAPPLKPQFWTTWPGSAFIGKPRCCASPTIWPTTMPRWPG